jgi:ABC-type multidrug transport system ATPase subunit
VTAPLLRCDQPRFVGEAVSFGQFEAQGPRLVLVGAWAPLFELLAGERSLSGGSVQVAGIDAEGAARSGRVGLALRDAPLPPSWTLGEVLKHSAALLGDGRRLAAERARLAADELGPGERRAASIAAACLGEPAVLALEEPFAGLEPASQAYVVAVLERALRTRPALISVCELSASVEQDNFVQSSDELLFLARHGLVARGPYAELVRAATSYRVVVTRSAEGLLSRLTEAGYEVRRVELAEVTSLVVVDSGSLGTLPLFRAALEADAPIVELVPFNLRGAEPAVSSQTVASQAAAPHGA